MDVRGRCYLLFPHLRIGSTEAELAIEMMVENAEIQIGQNSIQSRENTQARFDLQHAGGDFINSPPAC